MSRVFGICLLFLNISMMAGMFSSDSLDTFEVINLLCAVEFSFFSLIPKT